MRLYKNKVFEKGGLPVVSYLSNGSSIAAFIDDSFDIFPVEALSSFDSDIDLNQVNLY